MKSNTQNSDKNGNIRGERWKSVIDSNQQKLVAANPFPVECGFDDETQLRVLPCELKREVSNRDGCARSPTSHVVRLCGEHRCHACDLL